MLLVGAVRGYQLLISPWLPGRCKYYPSCSQYTIDALRQCGVFRGLILAAWRVLRCNPFSYGGYDPVERRTLFAPRSQSAVPASAAVPASTATPASAATPAVAAASGPVLTTRPNREKDCERVILTRAGRVVG